MRSMAIRIAALALVLSGPLPCRLAAAQEAASPTAPSPATPDVIVRASLDPATGAIIGQHVALFVDVLFRGEMQRPPRVNVPDVPGVQILRFETQGLTMHETIDGAAFTGQRFEFALYARRGGAFDIAPATVTLLDRQGAQSGTAQGQAVRLDVTVPPGIDASQPVVTTSKLTLAEQWAPDPKGVFKAGDAIVRTITRTAEDVPGLAMRDLAFAAPDGVRVYVDPPDIADQSNRGVTTGRRTDRVTYVFERGGSFALPALAQPWWDLAAGAARSAQAPGATITVAAAPAVPADIGGGSSRLALALVAAALIAALLVVALLLRSRRHIDGEQAAFDALRQACAGSDADAAYRAFATWRGFLPPAQRDAASAAIAPLEAALFTDRPAPWRREDGDTLFRRLADIRRARDGPAAVPALAPLNPAGG